VCAATAAEGFDILQILGKHDEFSQFCKLLNETHLAGDINRDRTITVLAVANALGLDALGIELSGKRCRAARKLTAAALDPT